MKQTKQTYAMCTLLLLGVLALQFSALPVAAQIGDPKKIKVPPTVVQPTLPTTLNIVEMQPGKKSSSVVLRQVKYSGPTAVGRVATGTADLALTLVGHPLPVLKNQKFTTTVQDKFGRATGTQITLGEDLTATHFLGGKLDLTLEKGGQIVSGPASKGGTAAHFFKGSVRVRLPYVTESGKPVEIHLGRDVGRKPIEIPLSANAFVLADQRVAIPPTTFRMNGFKFLNVQAFQSFRLNVHPQQSKPYGLETVIEKTQIVAYLPRFLLKQGFVAYAQQIQIEPSVPEPGQGQSNAPEEYLSTFTAATLAPPTLQFIRPAGFGMACKGITLKVIKGEYTEAKVEGALTLPAAFTKYQETPKTDSTYTPQPAKEGSEIQKPLNPPVTIAAKLTYQIAKGKPGWSAIGSDPISLEWGRFGLFVEATQYSLMLDGPGGIRVTGGNFVADAFMDSNGILIKIPIKTGDEFFLTARGTSGQIAINPKELKSLTYPGTGYKIIITSPASIWRFNQGHLSAVQTCTGTIDVPTKADLAVKITINVDGDPSASVAGGHLSLPAFGIYFAITQGTLKPPEHYVLPKQGNKDEYKKWLFHLSGTITFDTPTVPELKGVVVPVTDIIFNAQGLFGDPYEKNPKTRIPIGQIDVNLKSFVLVLQNFDLPNSQQTDPITKQNDPHLSLNGKAWLADNLPLIKYDPGIRIAPTKATAQQPSDDAPQFVSTTIDAIGAPEFGKIHVHEDLGFAVIDFELSKDKRLFGGQMTDCLFGKGTLKLASEGAGGGGLNMFVAKGSWLVAGTMDLTTAIPLGSTPLKLYGFRGGLGHNVNVKPNVISSGVKAGQMSIDDFVYAPGNFLFQAGVGIETSDEFLVWGDAMLTLTTSPFSFNVGVFANIAEARSATPSGSRTATGLITVTSDSFTAQLAVDLNVPDRSIRLARISGTSTLNVDPSGAYLHIGTPIPGPNAGSISLIGGLLNLQGGMAIDVEGDGVTAMAAFMWRQSFLGIVEGEMDGYLKCSLKDSGATLAGGVHIYGEVDFYVFSAYVEAWLNGSIRSSPLQLHVDGGIAGCIDTPIGDACASLHFSATWP